VFELILLAEDLMLLNFHEIALVSFELLTDLSLLELSYATLGQGHTAA
jgi:hypothetical protein